MLLDVVVSEAGGDFAKDEISERGVCLGIVKTTRLLTR